MNKTREQLIAAHQYHLVSWDYKYDIGFLKLSGRSNMVACVICGRSGPGPEGSGFSLNVADLMRWQYKCIKPHTEPCACGKYFPTKHALATHVSANRRHRIPGHGRMDRVG